MRISKSPSSVICLAKGTALEVGDWVGMVKRSYSMTNKIGYDTFQDFNIYSHKRPNYNTLFKATHL